MVLEISHLTRKFGAIVAVDDVSFALSAGEVLGLLGANGAGKSTTLKMIAGRLAPTGGTAVICGHDIVARPLRAKRRIGYLPEGAPAYGAMTAAAFLGFIARIRGLHGREKRRAIAYIVELIGLGELLRQPVETLSQSQRRRLGVAQALLHDPAVVVLDEPTGGLDPKQQSEMRDVIRAVSPGKAIVIATHRPADIEAVCTRAVILAGGHILAAGTLAELAACSRYHNAVRLALAGGADMAVAAELARLPGVLSVEPASDDEGAGWWVLPWRARPIADAVRQLVRARGWPVSVLRVEHGRLDEVFRAITMPEAAATETPGVAA